MALATVYDSVTAGDLPAGGDGYLAYLNGRYANVAAVAARFPGKPIKTITVNGALQGLVLAADISDCETSDYDPSTAAQWAKNKISSGLGKPTIYCNTSTYGDVANALAALRLQFGIDVWWLEAHYDDIPLISAVPGAIGKQYQSTATYDVSVVEPTWLGIDPPQPQETDVAVIFLAPSPDPTDQPTLIPVNAGDVVTLGFDAISATPVICPIRSVIHKTGTTEWDPVPSVFGPLYLFDLQQGYPFALTVPSGYDGISLRNQGAVVVTARV